MTEDKDQENSQSQKDRQPDSKQGESVEDAPGNSETVDVNVTVDTGGGMSDGGGSTGDAGGASKYGGSGN